MSAIRSCVYLLIGLLLVHYSLVIVIRRGKGVVTFLLQIDVLLYNLSLISVMTIWAWCLFSIPLAVVIFIDWHIRKFFRATLSNYDIFSSAIAFILIFWALTILLLDGSRKSTLGTHAVALRILRCQWLCSNCKSAMRLIHTIKLLLTNI